MGIIELIIEVIGNIIFDVRSVEEPMSALKFILIVLIFSAIVLCIIKAWFFFSFLLGILLLILIKFLHVN